jgi:hypothetical protein
MENTIPLYLWDSSGGNNVTPKATLTRTLPPNGGTIITAEEIKAVLPGTVVSGTGWVTADSSTIACLVSQTPALDSPQRLMDYTSYQTYSGYADTTFPWLGSPRADLKPLIYSAKWRCRHHQRVPEPVCRGHLSEYERVVLGPMRCMSTIRSTGLLDVANGEVGMLYANTTNPL